MDHTQDEEFLSRQIQMDYVHSLNISAAKINIGLNIIRKKSIFRGLANNTYPVWDLRSI